MYAAWLCLQVGRSATYVVNEVNLIVEEIFYLQNFPLFIAFYRQKIKNKDSFCEKLARHPSVAVVARIGRFKLYVFPHCTCSDFKLVKTHLYGAVDYSTHTIALDALLNVIFCTTL